MEPFKDAAIRYHEISFAMSFNESLKEALNMTGHIAILYKENMLAKNEPSIKNYEAGEDAPKDALLRFIFENYLLEVDIYC